MRFSSRHLRLVTFTLIGAFAAEEVACSKKEEPAVSAEGTGAFQPFAGSGQGSGAAAAAPTADMATAVAAVDGKPVMSKPDLDAELQTIVERYEKLPEREPTTARWRNMRRRRIVQKAVQDALIGTFVSAQNVTVTDPEIEAALKAELGHVFDDQSLFERFLQSHGQTREEYMNEKREEMALDKVLAQRGAIEPTDQELQEFYDQDTNRWQEGERVLVSTITVRVRRDADPQTDQQAKDKINALRDRVVKNSEDFGAVAREASESADRVRDGDMGWIVKGQRPQLATDGVEAVIFRAAPETVTEPIRTALGYQIFLVKAHRQAGLRALDEVRDTIYEPLKRRRRDKLRMDLVNELLSKAKVDYFENNWGLEPEPSEGSAAPGMPTMPTPGGVIVPAPVAVPALEVAPPAPAPTNP